MALCVAAFFAGQALSGSSQQTQPPTPSGDTVPGDPTTDDGNAAKAH
jgi:hypothetical protein